MAARCFCVNNKRNYTYVMCFALTTNIHTHTRAHTSPQQQYNANTTIGRIGLAVVVDVVRRTIIIIVVVVVVDVVGVLGVGDGILHTRL